MLEYRLDDLSWQDFENLCQALLKAMFGLGIESWGGSGDWGNDAYCRSSLRYPGSEVQEGPFQFQAKFVQGANAAGAKPGPRLLAAVKRECERIKKRDQLTPRVYSLLTNVVLQPQLRAKIEEMIRAALPNCDTVALHGGNDICSWLHLHHDVTQLFPQLLSHRNLSELVRQAQHGEIPKTKARKKPPISAILTEKKKLARNASRKHQFDSALRLWDEVLEQAEREGNDTEKLGARLETIVILAQEGTSLDEVVKLSNECLQYAKTIDVFDDQCRLFQLIGEVYRINEDYDQARGFIKHAIECAQETGSKRDEGFALLSLSLLEDAFRGEGNNRKALDFIERAYDAFASLYAAGDEEDKRNAQDGFARCHCLRAELFDIVHQDDALIECKRALDIFKMLGEGWEWNSADVLLLRADLHLRAGERKWAFADLDHAARIFHEIADTYGVAKCYLKAGEFLDADNKRDEAKQPYQRAASIAATWNNERRASYFYFRYACKLIELREHQDAEKILSSLACAESIDHAFRLTIISQLCFVAEATGKEKELKERCTVALALIDELIQESVSAEKRRNLLIKKGALLQQLGKHEEAVDVFNKALSSFESIKDQSGITECWYHIRGVWQDRGDQKREREALERVIALENDNPMWTALSLVGLAQLNLNAQRFTEARQQLSRAEELDPKNPVVAIVASDLREKLPRLSLHGQPQTENDRQIPQRDLPALVEELHEWCDHYPKMRRAILPLWYYIHRKELWEIIRSMLGVKFLVCVVDARKFASMKTVLGAQGDLYLWGTNFSLNSKNKPEFIPVPDNFLYPAGTTVVIPETQEVKQTGKNGAINRKAKRGDTILEPVTEKRKKPYWLCYLRDMEGYPDGTPFFVGEKTRLDERIVRYMLGAASRNVVEEKSLCLPLTERGGTPNLRHTMQVAWEIAAIPVFRERLPYNDDVAAVCDTVLEVPKDVEAPITAAKELWARLLSSCTDNPQLSLTSFTNGMTEMCGTEKKDRQVVRAYILRFHAGSQEEVLHPAVVVRVR